MRLLIAAVGRLKQGPEQDLFVHYIARADAAGRKLGLGPLSFDRHLRIAKRDGRFAPRGGGRCIAGQMRLGADIDLSRA